MAVTTESVDIRVIGGPTIVIEIGGLRLLTDPTFDGVRDYTLGPGLVLSKTQASPVGPDELRPVDVVLLSHDQHPDNLDESGRSYLADALLVLTTPSAATRLGGRVVGLHPWDCVDAAPTGRLPALGDRHPGPARARGLRADDRRGDRLRAGRRRRPHGVRQR